VRSLHDALGTPLDANSPDAAADAEQIAATEMTLAGVPPASLCAERLRPGVLKLCRSLRVGDSRAGPAAAHCGANVNMFSVRGSARLPTF